MLYKFMTEIQIQNGRWQRSGTKYVNEKELKKYSLQKLCCNAQY